MTQESKRTTFTKVAMSPMGESYDFKRAATIVLRVKKSQADPSCYTKQTHVI